MTWRRAVRACSRPYVAAALAASVAVCGCKKAPPAPPATLHVGIGGAPSVSAERGVQQFISNITNEGLLRVNQEGRLEAWLAKGWERSADGLRLTLHLRDNVKFHDGSPVTTGDIAAILKQNLPKTLRNIFDDVKAIAVVGPSAVQIELRRPSVFVADALMDIQVLKTGESTLGTGPFVLRKSDAPRAGAAEMSAFPAYYLGPPALSSIAIQAYPNGRAAWADLLRGNVDMLYEVDANARATMQEATTVSLYEFERPFQYVVLLNTKNPKLKSPVVRQALNQAINRAELVRSSLQGAGRPSEGPVSAHHWAFARSDSPFTYDPARAAATLKQPLVIHCLTPAGPPYEQLAIAVKQQLHAVGVTLEVDEVSPDNLVSAVARPEFEAMLIDVISGWSLFRPYRWWHTAGSQNATGFSSVTVDAALDRIRNSVDDQAYVEAVHAFQRAVADDPPAIFLAWSDRSRGVSTKFDVEAQPGRDVLATLRMWHPASSQP